MQRRPLGQSSLEVPGIALGTWAMGGDVHGWGTVDDRESIAAIQQAIDCGLNLVDTAPTYGRGHGEEVVGKAIQGRRRQVLLATKCGLLLSHSPSQPPRRCLRASSVIKECEQSLRRLRTDVIDLYECHWPDPYTPIQETMQALMNLRSQGKIRAIGLSNFGCEQISAAREYGPIHALQISFSMLNRRAAEDLIPYCAECYTAVLAYGALAKGLLTGKFCVASKFTDPRARDPDFTGQRFRRNLAVVEELKTLAARYGKTSAQVAINWASTHEGVTSVIVGAKRPSQVLENAGGVGWTLTAEDRSRLDAKLMELAP